MADSYYLVLIETSGNQNYIFSTNKLKENIGASELTYQAGTFWVGEAVDTQNQQEHFKKCRTPKEFREALRNQATLNKSGHKAEILVAASGKALILTSDKTTATNIISEVTCKALIKAPGLDIGGVYQEIQEVKNFEEDETLSDAIKAVHKTFEKARSRRPSPDNRFLRLPIIASCTNSGMPATKVEKIGSKQVAISQVSAAKRKRAEDAKSRLKSLDERLQDGISQLLRDNDSDEDNQAWLGIVHADGNGLGQIFLSFEDYIGEDKNNRNYINHYREFSLTLDECTEKAFQKALNVFPKKSDKKQKEIVPIVPLIIGGDDLTVVCDGHYALEFTRVFLQEFELQTQHPAIAEIAKEAFEVGRLSACAGVAIVKRHFPFSVAYNLAESLIKSAKEVKKKITCKPTEKNPENTPFPCSAIDFHILYDTSNVNLKDIRARLNPEANVQLYHRPYVVSNIENLNNANGKDWAEAHRWEKLDRRVKHLNNKQATQPEKATQSDKSPVSSSQSHALRTALQLNKAEADAQYKLIHQRYDLKPFQEAEGSLFHQTDEGNYATSFLDALDAMDFFENAENDPQSKDSQDESEVAA